MARPRRAPSTSSRVRARVTKTRPVGYDGKSLVPLVEDVHTPDEVEKYLTALRDGGELDVAARAIKSTATRMKRFCDRDPEFAEAVEAAVAEGKITYRDRLRATARTRATALEGGSDRMLEVELATHVPGYEHLRRDRVRHEGNVEHTIRIPIDEIEQLDLDEAIALRNALAKMGGAVIDVKAKPRELGPGT